MRSLTPFQLLGLPVAAILFLSLEGCPTRPQAPEPSSSAKVAPSSPAKSAAPPQRHEGRPFDIVSNESLLTILAFRGGTLAKVGHNHVIASHDVTGTFYVAQDGSHSTFELHIPVAQLSVDEPDLRAKEGPDFPPDVPDSAKEGTRRNMLSEALLNGAQYPEIVLTARHIDIANPGSRVTADVEVAVRGQTHTISVPVTYSLSNGQLMASGELPLKQSDLGLTPFTALLGALAVQDEMKVRFRFVAHRAKTSGVPGNGRETTR